MITLEQALTANVFYHVGCHRSNGHPREWRRNGKTQTWKRTPGKFRVPVKYGLYAYDQVTNETAHLLVTVDYVDRVVLCDLTGLRLEVPDWILVDKLIDIGMEDVADAFRKYAAQPIIKVGKHGVRYASKPSPLLYDGSPLCGTCGRSHPAGSPACGEVVA